AREVARAAALVDAVVARRVGSAKDIRVLGQVVLVRREGLREQHRRPRLEDGVDLDADRTELLLPDERARRAAGVARRRVVLELRLRAVARPDGGVAARRLR